MKKILFLIKIALIFILCFATTNLRAENKKLAQTGFQFLSIVSDARAAAMA
jgi:hypothetical protein